MFGRRTRPCSRWRTAVSGRMRARTETRSIEVEGAAGVEVEAGAGLVAEFVIGMIDSLIGVLGGDGSVAIIGLAGARFDVQRLQSVPAPPSFSKRFGFPPG